MESSYETAASGQRLSLASEWRFLCASALLWAAGVAGTVYLSVSVSGGIPMSAGSSMVWIRQPGQTWLEAGGWFLSMWFVMMLAMMLPSLIPSLLSYRRSVPRLEGSHLGGLTLLAGVGYFAVWAVFGVIAYPLGLLVVGAEMQWMNLASLVLPVTIVVLLLAGILQFTRWKACMLEDYRQAPTQDHPQSPQARSAWQFGLRLGMHCVLCCIGFMVVLLATGVMNLLGMALVAAAITLERLAPKPDLTARLLGFAVILAGSLTIARAAGII